MKNTITLLNQSFSKGKFLVACLIFFGELFSHNSFSQAPNISSIGSPYTFTTGTAIASLTPTNTGGAVPATTPGSVTTFEGCATNIPGSPDETGTNAGFYYPTGFALDALGNVYVADYYI
jgi:hypothetical protein